MVNSAEEPVVSYLTGTTANAFNNTNTYVVWQIDNVQAKCDLCQLENSLQNSYAGNLQNGSESPVKLIRMFHRLNRFIQEQAVNRKYVLMLHGH